MSYELEHLSFTIFENTCVLLHAKQNAPDESWGKYLKAMARYRFTGAPRILVFSDGGGPTPAQRQLLANSTSGLDYYCAVIGEAAITRFIVASLALANPHTRSFYPRELPQALEHLQLPGPQLQLRQTLQQLSTQIPNASLAKATQQTTTQ